MAKIAFFSDSAWVTSGFGGVNRVLLKAAREAGHEVAYVAAHQFDPIPRSEDMGVEKIWYGHPLDPFGFQHLPRMLNSFDPDVLFMHYDPGNLSAWSQDLRMRGYNGPIVGLYPVEGLPLRSDILDMERPHSIPFNMQLRDVWRIDVTLTYTNWGADAVAAYGVRRPGVQRLGWDHGDFRIISRELKTHLRRMCGFPEHAFIVANVAYNKRTNNHGNLIEAMKQVRAHAEDIILYAHTSTVGDGGNGGGPLGTIYDHWDSENVLFRDQSNWQFGGTPARAEMTDEEILALPIPTEKEEQGATFNALPFHLKLAMMDLYIDPSSVQGWNLPSGEALASGLPLISVNDGEVRSEIFGEFAYSMMEPSMHDYWHTGAILHMVSAETIANHIISAYNAWKIDPNTFAAQTLARSLAAREQLKWDTKPFINALETALNLGDQLLPEGTLYFPN